MFAASALCLGCTITFGGSASLEEDSAAEGSESGKAHLLPEPTVWRVEPPQLTPEQQQRYDEVDQYLVAELFGEYKIVEATQGYSGDIYYWVDSNTLPPTYQTAPSWTAEDLIPPEGAELGRTELELYPELRGSPGTPPFSRPDFSMYIMGLTGATSVRDYVENYQVSGQPAGQNRLYADEFNTHAFFVRPMVEYRMFVLLLRDRGRS